MRSSLRRRVLRYSIRRPTRQPLSSITPCPRKIWRCSGSDDGQKAYKALCAGLDTSCKTALEALLIVKEEEKTSPFAWLRQWQEMPKLKNLMGILERLNTVRKLAVAPDREQRIHRARYMAIVREVAIMDAQHLSRQDEARQIASLIVFVRETEARLIDAALAMAGKMVGQVFRTAEKSHKEHLSERAKVSSCGTRPIQKLSTGHPMSVK